MEENFDQFDGYWEDDNLQSESNNDSDMFESEQTEETPKESVEPEEQEEVKNDALSRILRERGIDRHNIQFQNENGDIELYDFDDLTEDEKYFILSEKEDSPLTDEEIETLNFLRSNRFNLQQFAQYTKDEAIREYLEQNGAQRSYSIDQISDDDLYRFDLKDRYPSMTDEEIEDELDAAKVNENLFERKIEALRTEYKELEERKLQEDADNERQQMEAQFQDYANNMVSVANDIHELHGLELETQDKEEILSFLLDKDANGQTEFIKLFDNPEACFKLAWYALHGDAAFTAVNNYYQQIIEKTRRQNKPTQRRIVHKTEQKPKSIDPGLDKYFK